MLTLKKFIKRALAIMLIGGLALPSIPVYAQDASTPQEKYLEKVDSNYGLEVTKKITTFKSQEKGFRIAGTPAENAAAEWISQEMKRIGLKEVSKDSFPVDAWEFKGGSVTIEQPAGITKEMEIASFTCSPGTKAEGLTGDVVYVGYGTKADYEGLDVKDKIVLIDTDAFNMFWFNVPFAQAEVRGAKAIITTALEGPGTYKDDAVSCQDVCGQINVPAVVLSKSNADVIKGLLKEGKTVNVKIKSDITINPDGKSYNVYGKIPGKDPNHYVIIGDHYDAYFEGFQDNATGVGTTLTIAKAMIDSGYQPNYTLIFVVNGAEEYGDANNYYDYLTGSYYMVNKLHPEWATKAIAYNNFEMTAWQDTGKTWAVNIPQEYEKYFTKLLRTLDIPKDKYPEGFELQAPVWTMADQAPYSLAGIPAFCNLSMGDVWWTLYHTKYDNETTYDARVFDFNNKAYGLIDMAFDNTLVAPLDFTGRATGFWGETDLDIIKANYSNFELVDAAVKNFEAKAEESYALVTEANRIYELLQNVSASEEVQKTLFEMRSLALKDTQAELEAYQLFQSDVMKLDRLEDEEIYGYTHPYKYVAEIDSAISALKGGDPESALESIGGLDNNYIAEYFDKEVYDIAAIMAFDPTVNQNWGNGKTLPCPDMYDVYNAIKDKSEKPGADFTAEIAVLHEMRSSQKELLANVLDKEAVALQTIAGKLNGSSLKEAIALGEKALQQVYSAETQYSDIPQTHWAYDSIMNLQTDKIVAPMDQFNPNSIATRGEYAKWLTEALNLTVDKTAASSFSDVKAGDVNSPYIEAAVSAGLLKGTPDGRFLPSKGITRAELATIISRVLTLQGEESASGTMYQDVSAKAWYASAVEAATLEGVLKGTGNGKYEPGRMMTRAEVAAALDRLLFSY